MNARAVVASAVSLVLALLPAAQAQVVSGRAAVAPVGGLGIRPVSAAPQLSLPSSVAASLGAPGLAAPLAAAPAPAAAAAPAPALLAAPALAPLPAPSVASAERPAAESARTAPSAVVARRFAELKLEFGDKTPETLPAASNDNEAPAPLAPSAAEPASAAGRGQPPSPPQAPQRKGLFGFSRSLTYFLLALVLSQVGMESQTAALPPLISKVFGDVSVAAGVGTTAALADLAGTILAPLASKKLGLKKAYVVSTALRVATGGLVAGLLATGWIGLGGLTALMAADNLFYGISYTLEKSIPAVMVDQDQQKLERFKAARQTAIETVATVVPIATGALVAAAGFLPALIAFPVAVAASVAVVSLTLRLPAKLADASAAPLPGPQRGALRAYLKGLTQGAKTIARTPALLYSLLAYALVYAPTTLVYWMAAPAFALQLTSDAAHATAFAGMITGLYSLGGIVAGVYLMRRQSEPRDEAAMRRSMLKWSAACGAAMLLFGALALPGLSFGTVTAPAIAMLLFGFPQVLARLKLESFFQSKVPKGAVADSTAVLESATSVVVAAGLWWFGKALAGANVLSPLWIAAAVAPLAIPLLLLTWALARASKC